MPKRYRFLCEDDMSGNDNANSIDTDNRIIYLFDLIDERTAMMISQSFRIWRSQDAKKRSRSPIKNVTFVLSCPGGYIETVTGIIAEMSNKNNKFKIFVDVISIAYSAAAILLLYVPRANIRMYSGGQVMFHYSRWSTHELNIPEHERDSKLQRIVFDNLMHKGLTGSKLTLKELTPLMATGDAYFSAQECLNKELIGEIYG